MGEWLERARRIAQMQSELVLAEQSLVYGEEMCKDIAKDLQRLDGEFSANAKGAHEDICAHAEERIGIIREMDLAKGRIVLLKARLQLEGAEPKQQTMAEQTFGARMALMTKLAGIEGSGAENFGFTSAAKHFLQSREFAECARAAERAGNIHDFTHNLASAHFYAAASRMLVDIEVRPSVHCLP